jgi:acyl dehydratase
MAFDLALVGKPSEPKVLEYGWKDVVLYALGVGAKKDELDYLYEGKGPKVYPSFAVVPAFEPVFDLLRTCGGNLAMVVHGAQKVVLAKPFAPSGKLVTTAKIRGFYDLRKFAIAYVDTESKDAAGELVCETSWNIVFRGEGGFGGEPPPRDKGPSIPKDRAPDFTMEETTSPEQALLYRLSGDHNPLHADPAFAAEVGFAQGPILHGLCTYGYMVRHLVKTACGGDGAKLTAFEGGFKRPVWPGDTLVTEAWTVEPGKLAVQMKVKERDEVVLGGAWARVG